MIPDKCQYCGGKLHEGTTEITAKVNNTVIVIKNIPAFVCENCDEAYYSLETARKIDEVRRAFRAGTLLVKPLAAGEEGTEMENEIVESNADKIVGLLKHIDMDSVELQHEARDIWAKKVVSDFPKH